MESWRQHIPAAAQMLRDSRCCVALTGAGISVASGIPDFRSPGGLWSRHDPMRVATLAALRRDPRQVWEFLLDANRDFDAARPNAGHTALASLEAAGRLQAIITQNIDGLHTAAGSRRVVEFHGNARRYYCMTCKTPHPAQEAASLTRSTIPWTCRCGGVVRPDIVFFGEHIPPQALAAAMALTRQADLLLIVGTSGEVAPASQLPWEVKDHGGRVIELNAGDSLFGALPDLVLRARAEEVLPALAALVLNATQHDLQHATVAPERPQ
ncbi:SIR2 family NAD-dependent protein deacylase [Megalodesulfovibrio gigas]|uniref:protein acetyllysine N-acetyltransferase n=1 Tax=Megalodesulfovibrio gigas (strain ATCC 19364 / DSM 1382 / NCIMB 9332 / VKM B-1759) TaxID=1121448 RepID=T2GFC3_MEGG1|nr:NAD-dependent deacylase [Megalodesulfovibrio gigas]AGW14884.1 putative NAD-dependent deacetylase [Megalodesulfovibrio gigas DSM 1382 = ATCC 19364]